jgi:hypothetical protein
VEAVQATQGFSGTDRSRSVGSCGRRSTPWPGMTAPEQQTVFPQFVKDLLTAEDKRHDSLDARGASIITVSGTLVTLLLAVAAFPGSHKGVRVGGDTQGILTVVVVAFVLAAVFAVATYAPQPARIVDAVDLRRTLPAVWDKGDGFATKKTTATYLDQLAVAQRTNDRKARLLLAAVAMQVVAVVGLAAAVATVL